MDADFFTQGFSLHRGVVAPELLDSWLGKLAPLLRDAPAGVRQLRQKVPDLQQLVEAPEIRELITAVLGENARLVRSILFNKTPDSNWQVGWHQDLSIAVAERVDLPGYGGWSVKQGVPHVQAPLAVLENMVTLRLHLDDADTDNGALWVAPGSHRLGRIDTRESEAVAGRLGKLACICAAGDVLLMRPLLLHASFKTSNERPRRVIHLEFAAEELSPPMRWYED